MPDSPAADDPIVARRNRIRRLAALAQRVAYGLLGLATVAFFIGLATSFTDSAVLVILVPLIGGCVILAIAIQVGYAIRGAERHEQESAAQRRRP